MIGNEQLYHNTQIQKCKRLNKRLVNIALYQLLTVKRKRGIGERRGIWEELLTGKRISGNLLSLKIEDNRFSREEKVLLEFRD